MIYFLLGIIVGMIVLTTCLLFCSYLLNRNLPRVKQVVKKLEQVGKKKSILLNPEDNQIKGWVDNLPSG